MLKPAAALVTALLALPAFAQGTPELHLAHPPTYDKGPNPPVNFYFAVPLTAKDWLSPAHEPTRDWGPGAVRPHVVLDAAKDRPDMDHPPTRDWGPDRVLKTGF